MHVFATPQPPRLRVEIPKGRIELSAAPSSETRIELTAIDGDATAQAWIDEAEVGERDGEIVVIIKKPGFSLFGWGGPGVLVAVQAPQGVDARLTLGAGRIDASGSLGRIKAETGAGPITIGDAAQTRARSGAGDITILSTKGSVDARTGSGRVTVGQVGADVSVSTGSGNAKIAQVTGAAKLTTGSGNLEVGRAGDSVEAFTASGNVAVHAVDHGRVRAKTVAGRVSVGVANGAAAWLDITTMSGRVNNALKESAPPAEGEPRVELIINTLSGNVDVARV